MKWFGKKNSTDKNKFNFDRLLQVNAKDPAINARLSNNLIDLSSLVDHQKIFEFLSSNKTDFLLENKDLGSILLNEIDKLSSLDELLDFCKDNNIELTESELTKLTKNFKLNKSVILNAKITKNLVTLSKKINQFVITNKQNIINENIYTLYLATNFLKGTIEDVNINAPLLLYKIEVLYKNSNIYLHKLDLEPILNEKINFLLSKKLNIKFDFKEDLNFKAIVEYKKYLQGHIKNSDTSFSKEFISFDEKNQNYLSIQNNLTLMLIEPTGGSIKKDIEQILQKKINPFEVNTKITNIDDFQNDVIQNDDIIEINQKLNIYQKYAIKSALIQNTLIYGPPGTGKSEVLASCIANIIYQYNGKPLSILISSEKKVALNIIEKRIGQLNNLSINLVEDNQTIFFERLKKYEEFLRKTFKKINFKSSSEQYEKILNLNQSLFSLLDTKLSNNLSFNEFLTSTSDLNLVDFTKYYQSGYLKTIKNIMDKQKINPSQFYSFACRFQDVVSRFKNEMNILIMHKNFDSFDSKFLREFLQKYEQSSKQDFIISSLITKNKIVTKKPIFGGTQKLVLDLDQQKMIDLLKGLVSLDIHTLSRDEVVLIKDFKLDENNLNKFIIYYDFINSILKNKYVKQESINSLFNQYSQSRKEISINNDDLVFENFIYKKCAEINKLNDTQKNKLFELFGLAYLKVKPSVNFVVKKYFDQLKFLFPIWFSSPEQVSSLVPNEQHIFNYGIFDEASQMFVEKSFPLVYRSKIKIVAGDDKQLQPSSFFMKKVDNDVEEQINTESLFEIANVCLWTKFYLKNHYRSKAAELIRFSNEYFYENKLEFSTYNGFNDKPVTVYEVNGVWQNNHNLKEIETIVNILNKEKSLINKNILVVSFNAIQSRLLAEKFNQVLAKSKVWMKKMQEGTISFYPLEEVQGNEADVVILSISYAKDENNKLRQFFGPLSQANGKNRLNVAITRAKERMFIVKSMNSSDIKLSENENNNIFKYYLNYCEQFISSKSSKKQNELSNEYHFNFINENILDNIISFLKSLNASFTSQKYLFYKNYIVGNKLIDIAIYDKEMNKIIFGLKINGNQQNDLKNNIQFLDEVQFLRDLDYNIYTFNVIDWFIKNKLIQDEIIAILH